MKDIPYAASTVKRRRATKAEMEERAEFLISYAEEHGPLTSRSLYYQAEVASVPGIGKTESGYNKVQKQVLALRRAGRLPYWQVSDLSRAALTQYVLDGPVDALRDAAATYRKDLWKHRDIVVQVWLEKRALAGSIRPVTDELNVSLFPTSGYSSESFAYEAIAAMRSNHTGKRLTVLALYDWDRSGHDASGTLKEMLHRFGTALGVEVEFRSLALSQDQVGAWGLPTRPHKRETPADRNWPHDLACELDAIPPDDLRDLVRQAIYEYQPAEEFAELLKEEESEREQLLNLVEQMVGQ
jgi:hypothetical protein